MFNLFPSNQLTVLVSDETGKQALRNATVMVNNKTGRIAMGITNSAGVFSVPLSSIPDLNDVSVYVTYVGREEQTLSAGGKNLVAFQLKPAPKEIAEVVITGKPKVKPVIAATPVKKKKNVVLLVATSALIVTAAFILIRKGIT